MSDTIDPTTGLHLVHSDDETEEAVNAKLALADRLAEAAPDRGWSPMVWYGYLSAMVDCIPEITIDGARPAFSGLWELPEPFDAKFWRSFLQAQTVSFDWAFDAGAGSDVQSSEDPDDAKFDKRLEEIVTATRDKANEILDRS
jgi:hypothetical protein